jgi:hypothetical protein
VRKSAIIIRVEKKGGLMPRHIKDSYEAAVYCNRRLPLVKARVEADIETATSRGDFVRAYRYTERLYLVESRYWTTTPFQVSQYSDFS